MNTSSSPPITTFGPHALPPARANTVGRNTAVAKCLRTLEQDHELLMEQASKPILSPTVPRIKSLPLIGNILDIRPNLLAFLSRVCDECGDIGVFHFGRRPVVMLNSPDYAYAILVDQSDKLQKTPRARIVLRTMLGHSLITQEGTSHKRQRRFLAPAFQHRRIAAYADVMSTYTEHLQQEWRDDTTIDAVHEMLRLTLWISGKTLFNTDVLSEVSDLHKAMSDVNTCATAIMSALAPVPLSGPTPANRRFKQALARLDQTLFPMIVVYGSRGAR